MQSDFLQDHGDVLDGAEKRLIQEISENLAFLTNSCNDMGGQGARNVESAVISHSHTLQALWELRDKDFRKQVQQAVINTSAATDEMAKHEGDTATFTKKVGDFTRRVAYCTAALVGATLIQIIINILLLAREGGGR